MWAQLQHMSTTTPTTFVSDNVCSCGGVHGVWKLFYKIITITKKIQVYIAFVSNNKYNRCKNHPDWATRFRYNATSTHLDCNNFQEDMGLAWGSGMTLTGNKRVTWLTAASDDGRWGHIQWTLTHTQQAWTRYNSWHYKHGSWSSTRDHTHPRAARLMAQCSPHHKHPLLPIQGPGCSQTTSTPCGLPGLCSCRLFKTNGRQRDIGSWMLQEHGSSSRKTKRDKRTLTFYLSDL